MPKIFLRAFGNYDVDAVSRETSIDCDPSEGVTQQQFAEEVDINTIVKRFGLTGELPDGVGMPVSGDFTGVSDFRSAMELVRSAQESFMLLPANVRDRFANDPARVIAFLDDEANRDEAIRLGIVAKPAEEIPPASSS